MNEIIDNIPIINKLILEYLFEDLKLKNKENTLWLEFNNIHGKFSNYISCFTDDNIYGFYNKENVNNFIEINDSLKLINGLFNDTLPLFLKKHNKKISFLNINYDSYSLVKDILNKIKDFIDEDCIIVFKNFTNKFIEENDSVLRAFYEFVNENNVDYDWIALNSIIEMEEESYKTVALKINSINISYKYIFARFNEDISWIKEDNNIMKNSIIYNKGEPLNISNEIFLENLGRDPESYLNYIIDNYDNLADICIFSQGRISDHIIYGEYGTVNSLKRLKKDTIKYGKSPYIKIVNDRCWSADWNYTFPDGDIHKDPSIYKNNTLIKFIDWFNIYVNPNYKNITRFYPCCIFAVSKKLILSRSLEYYKILLDQVNHHRYSIEGAFIERSLYYIFDNL
jgi:hypothetical protein